MALPRAMAQALPGLEVDTRHMRTNLDRLRATLPDDVAEEWLHPALVQHAGRLARTQANRLSGALSALGPQVQKNIAESMV